jgi:ketosteroid isomerase-like protein
MDMENVIRQYFRAEEDGDVDAVAGLCAAEVVVRNAAQPPQHGIRGVREYVEVFRDRTSRRRFTLVSVAHATGVAYGSWEADLTFREGVHFGPAHTRRPFDLHLRGICRFKFDDEGKIVEIDVAHETSSAMNLALEASRE